MGSKSTFNHCQGIIQRSIFEDEGRGDRSVKWWRQQARELAVALSETTGYVKAEPVVLERTPVAQRHFDNVTDGMDGVTPEMLRQR